MLYRITENHGYWTTIGFDADTGRFCESTVAPPFPHNQIRSGEEVNNSQEDQSIEPGNGQFVPIPPTGRSFDHSHPKAASPAKSTLVSLWRAYKLHRQRKANLRIAARLDSAVLRDLGLSHAEIMALHNAPFAFGTTPCPIYAQTVAQERLVNILAQVQFSS